MRLLARILIRLYPAEWQSRYGEELSALIDDSPVHVGAIFDLTKGVLEMHSKRSNFPRLAMMLGLTGLLVALGLSYVFLPPNYVSVATLVIHGSSNPAERLMAKRQRVLSRTSLKTIIEDPQLDLYKRDRENAPLEDVVERMRTRDISIRLADAKTSSDERVPFTIEFSYPDRQKARQVVELLLERFQEPLRDTAEKMSARPLLIDVVDAPNLPSDPIKPNRLLIAAFGFVSGFLLAVVVAISRRRFPPPPSPAPLS